MDPYLGEIRLFAGSRPPMGWAFCQGQLLSIPQHMPLYTLIGVTYGGDDRTTFALPDLRGRVPVGAGAGPDLTPRKMGERGGEAMVALKPDQLPSHAHVPMAAVTGNQTDPVGYLWSNAPRGAAKTYSPTVDPEQAMAPEAIGRTGGNAEGETMAHDNEQPYLALNYIIALEGEYPSPGD